MNIIFDLIFEDDTPYSVVMNLDALEKHNEETKKLVEEVRECLQSKKRSVRSRYEVMSHVWDAWESEGVRPSYPMTVHGEITLYL